MDIVVKKSKINGKGVFAKRDFKKGEIILQWNPKIITKIESDKLTIKQKNYLFHEKNKYFLMQVPEKYVNHSCEPNTTAKDKSDIAKRDIKKGEEITSSYSKVGFKCKCGNKNCRNIINKI
jgi:SET domain-containing protein